MADLDEFSETNTLIGGDLTVHPDWSGEVEIVSLLSLQ
jgi:hypothetical protein